MRDWLVCAVNSNGFTQWIWREVIYYNVRHDHSVCLYKYYLKKFIPIIKNVVLLLNLTHRDDNNWISTLQVTA